MNLLRRADAAGQRLFRELVAKRIAWAAVSEVRRLIAVDLVAVSLPAPGCDHPQPCRMVQCLDSLELKAVVGNRAARLPGMVLAHGAGVGGRVLATGRPFSVADYSQAPFEPELVELTAHEEGIGALLAVPISFAGVVRGVLHAGLRHTGGFGPGAAEALSRLATYAGAALAAAGDRARVEELARLRERRRLVRALHDDLGQHLFGVGVQARRARESAATGHPDLISHLHQLERRVAEAEAVLRTTMNSLAPVQAPGSTLTVMLSEDVAAFQQRTGLPSHLIVLGEPAPVDSGGAELLARVAREGLRNVERHAHASEVVVTLRVRRRVRRADGPGRRHRLPRWRGLRPAGPQHPARGGDAPGRRAAAGGQRRPGRDPQGMASGRVMQPQKTVVVADDHPIVISGMRLLLGGSRFFQVVGEARNGTEAILRCEQFHPDVLLLDLRLPDLPAATICQRIKDRQPETAIVILTAHPEEMALRGCMKAGASGCLFKDVSEQALLASLMQVAHGRTVVDPRVAGAMVRRDGGSNGSITEREHEVLELLARGLTTHEIGEHLRLSPNTVKSHTRSLFAKFEAHNRVQALAIGRERGLI